MDPQQVQMDVLAFAALCRSVQMVQGEMPRWSWLFGVTRNAKDMVM